MQERKVYKTQNLVLKVNPHYDPTQLDLSSWQRFLDFLCGDRDYQKKAIESAVIFLASNRYDSIEDLIRENYNKNSELQLRYKEVGIYFEKVQLPNKLSATIDLATGTGKSYVMYGIAQIMLGLGLVDRVLLLCPSKTIEKELHNKFNDLTTNRKLKLAIPSTAKWKNPSIVDASITVTKGSVCIENIHAVYERTGSSIVDSFGFKKGIDTLVLSDEVHHAYNRVSGNDKTSKTIKKWKEFLLDEIYSFRYMLGFTGTAYIENDYFNDVLYRYSLRQAIEEGFVKKIWYVSKDDSSNEYQKFQKIWQNHEKNKEKYDKVRPLTILVTNSVQNAKRLETRIVEFLAEKENTHEDEIREHKVLTVTSHKDHAANVIRLDDVDEKEESIEWIVSVSMLTEGWDVKNVFQIVPMEERAFNSKLLISQVLGRGLRVPLEYKQPKATIYNHHSWSGKIKGLVDEILEIETRLTNSNLMDGERSKHHFSLYNIDYKREFKTIENKEKVKVFDYSKELINFESAVKSTTKTTTYQNIGDKGEEQDIDYKIQFRMTPVKNIVNRIYNEFKTREWEGVILKLKDGEYTKNNLPPKKKLEEIIRNSMKVAGLEGDELNDKNKSKVFSAFNTLLRKTNKTVIPVRVAETPQEIKTIKRDRESLSIGSLRSNSTVFYTSDYEDEIQNNEVKTALTEVIEDDHLPKSAEKQINPFLFKTPVDIVFTSATPERKFVEKLCKKENATSVTAWLKSRNQSFYSIEYSISTKNHTKQARFNPDFFLKIDGKNGKDYIIVIEIKDDGDYSDENKAKLKWATQHFADLNYELNENNINQEYIFHFLSPENYDAFFDYLKKGKVINREFKSNLDIELTQ